MVHPLIFLFQTLIKQQLFEHKTLFKKKHDVVKAKYKFVNDSIKNRFLIDE